MNIPSWRLVGLTLNEKVRNEMSWCSVSSPDSPLGFRSRSWDATRHVITVQLGHSNAPITLSPRLAHFHHQRDRSHIARQHKRGPRTHAKATLGLEPRVIGRLADTKDRCRQTTSVFAFYQTYLSDVSLRTVTNIVLTSFGCVTLLDLDRVSLHAKT